MRGLKRTMSEIDEIRRQMAQIRHDLHQDVSSVVSGVSDVVEEVSEVMDWRSVLARHPYVLVSSAMLVGYLIVPRRKGKELDRNDVQAASLVSAPATSRKKGFRPLSWAMDLAWPIAMHSLQTYAMIWIEKQLREHFNLGPDIRPSDQPSDLKPPTALGQRFR